jgi:hypothetical protein
VAVLAAAVYGFSVFLSWVEGRSGHVMSDPVLDLFRPVSLSMLIFAVTYLPAAAGVIYSARFPAMIQRLASAYAVLLALRAFTLFIVPLDPPPGIIPLRDPLLELTVYEGRTNLRDLFFSGHTATHFLFFFLAGNRSVKIFFLGCALAVGVLVLMQHVHYTIDVMAAPFFAWLAARLSSRAGNL